MKILMLKPTLKTNAPKEVRWSPALHHSLNLARQRLELAEQNRRRAVELSLIRAVQRFD